MTTRNYRRARQRRRLRVIALIEQALQLALLCEPPPGGILDTAIDLLRGAAGMATEQRRSLPRSVPVSRRKIKLTDELLYAEAIRLAQTWGAQPPRKGTHHAG